MKVDPFATATTDANHVPKVVEQNNEGAAGSGGDEAAKLAAEEAAKSAITGKSADEIKPITADSIFGEEFKDKSFDDVKVEFQTRGEKLSKAESELAEARSKKPAYFDTEVAEWDAWLANGGVKDHGLFSKIKSLDSNTLDDIDAIITKQVIENPAFKGMEDRLKKEIVDKYQLEITEENKLTEEDIRFNRAKITSDAHKAKEFLGGLKSKLQVQQVDPESATKMAQKNKEAWAPIIDKVAAELKTIPIKIPKRDEEGKIKKDEKGNDILETYAEFQVPEHLQAEYKSLFQSKAETFGGTDEKSEGQLRSVMINKFCIEKLPYIVSHALQHQQTELQKEYDKKYGGKGVKEPGGNPNQSGATSSKEKMNEFTKTINASPN
ncbi:MAG TPA: hypothetical protein VK590_06205 [Saprospiraceae bacterium]|nr:hypothetical protein [Saprospiraceae bacterium]